MARSKVYDVYSIMVVTAILNIYVARDQILAYKQVSTLSVIENIK